jgi:hypothetical protein
MPRAYSADMRTRCQSEHDRRNEKHVLTHGCRLPGSGSPSRRALVYYHQQHLPGRSLAARLLMIEPGNDRRRRVRALSTVAGSAVLMVRRIQPHK